MKLPRHYVSVVRVHYFLSILLLYDLASNEMLFPIGAEVEIPSQSGEKPLHITAVLGKKSVVSELLRSGVNVDSTVDTDKTPLDIASSKGHSRVVSILLSYNAIPSLSMARG